MNTDLTKRQQAVLDCIEGFISTKGYGPTVREICTAMHLSSPSTVHSHLKALEEHGLITRDKFKSRSIALNYSIDDEASSSPVIGSTNDQIIALPLLGHVAAGEPLFAEENIEDVISLPISVVGEQASFMLRVRGESMIEAGINDGDYVVVQSQNTARNGDIVVAQLEDGATVKRFFHHGDYVELQPENSSMEPIIVRDNLHIAGKVIALFRSM